MSDYLPLLFQAVGALALLLTAAGSFVAAVSSVMNGRVAREVKASVDLISINVNGRFTASQEQISRLIEHVATTNPHLVLGAAEAAAKVLETARRALSAMPSPPAPIDVRIVTEEPVAVQVMKVGPL